MDLTHNTDLEWLSLNWRKYRASKMSKSMRRMILLMFQEDYQYLPSLKDIRNIEVPIPTDSELNLLESMRKSMDSLLAKCSNFQVLNKELNLSLKSNFLT